MVPFSSFAKAAINSNSPIYAFSWALGEEKTNGGSLELFGSIHNLAAV